MERKRIASDRLIMAYKKYKTCRATAKALGVSHATVSKMLKGMGVPVLERLEATKIARKRVSHYGKFAQFLREYKGKPLPRSISQLMELSGCTKDTIACYLTRRRKSVKAALKELPDLRSILVKLQDDLGDIHSSKDILIYEYAVDRFSLQTSILCEMKSGTKMVFSIPDLQLFITTILNIKKG